VVSRFCESIARKQLVALFGLYLKVGREWWFGMLRGRHVVVVVVLAAVECIDYYYYQQEDFQVMAPVHVHQFDTVHLHHRTRPHIDNGPALHQRRLLDSRQTHTNWKTS
jgi:hypothetical protein